MFGYLFEYFLGVKFLAMKLFGKEYTYAFSFNSLKYLKKLLLFYLTIGDL